MVQYWLMKSEPDAYSWGELVTDGSTHWDGVRNYQARNMMRDDMKIGDMVLFYHSNCKPPHVAGVARVCKEGYPDFTSWDTRSKYFDEKSNPEQIAVEAEEKSSAPADGIVVILQNTIKYKINPSHQVAA